MNQSPSKLLSVILLAYESGNRLRLVNQALSDILGQEHIDFELLIINDGSKDGGITKRVGKELESKFSNVRYFELSRNYTSHYAAFAGLSVCSGFCACIIPDDQQQPYETIVKSYRLWEEGEKIILPVRSSRADSRFSVFWATNFYKLLNYTTDFDYPSYGLDTWLIDREIIDILNNRISPINTTTISEILRLGFDPKVIFYDRVKSTAGKSRWTFKKKVKLASDWFFSTSRFPIRLVTWLGIFSCILSLTLICFYIYIKVFGNESFWKTDQVPGWVSLVVIISFFSGTILLSLALIAEYIWRIFEEVKGRPGFLIRK